jgi:hypothetical protein
MTQPTGNPLSLVYDDGSVEELRAAGWLDYLKLTGAVALGLAAGAVMVAVVTRLTLS